MKIFITPIFISILALFYLFLAMRIGYMRGSPVMKLFFKMDKEISPEKLNRNVRAHGNFSEYVPLYFLLLLVSELSEASSYDYMLVASLIFTYGRIAHAICFAFFDYNPFLRISGMLTTYMGIVMLSIKLISLYM
ncbi:MAG: MAPEG family protein [Gammaproteobacteria bacterium]|nr:MAPEG family protein [Gammaproteobacteria bacterium]